MFVFNEALYIIIVLNLKFVSFPNHFEVDMQNVGHCVKSTIIKDTINCLS